MAKKKDVVKLKDTKAIVPFKDLAKSVVNTISCDDLAVKVSEMASIPKEEAYSLLSNGLEKEIHSLLIDKIAEGSIAITALNALEQKAKEGNMEAVKLILGFNAKLRNNNIRTVENLTVNNNVFMELDAQAKKLLGESKDVIDVDGKEVK